MDGLPTFNGSTLLYATDIKTELTYLCQFKGEKFKDQIHNNYRSISTCKYSHMHTCVHVLLKSSSISLQLRILAFNILRFFVNLNCVLTVVIYNFYICNSTFS